MTVNDEDNEDFRSKPRWSAGKKLDVVLRVLRGESLDQLSRELGVEAHHVTTFEVGRFDDLPHPPRSSPLGERTDSPGVVVRSYGVTGTSPQQVLDFYNGALPAKGWVPEGPLETPGVGTYRSSWTNNGHHSPSARRLQRRSVLMTALLGSRPSTA